MNKEIQAPYNKIPVKTRARAEKIVLSHRPPHVAKNFDPIYFMTEEDELHTADLVKTINPVNGKSNEDMLSAWDELSSLKLKYHSQKDKDAIWTLYGAIRNSLGYNPDF